MSPFSLFLMLAALAAASWILIEAAFYLVAIYYIHPQINQLTTPPPCPKEALVRVVEALEHTKDIYSFEKFVQGWFLGAESKDVYEGNFRVNQWMMITAWVEHSQETVHIRMDSPNAALLLLFPCSPSWPGPAMDAATTS